MDEQHWKYTRELADLHNQVSFHKKPQAEFNEYVLEHESLLNHPAMVEILLENIEFTQSFIHKNLEMCKAAYRIIKRTNLKGSELGLRTSIRFGMFLDIAEEQGFTEV